MCIGIVYCQLVQNKFEIDKVNSGHENRICSKVCQYIILIIHIIDIQKKNLDIFCSNLHMWLSNFFYHIYSIKNKYT